jgi:hypothetical protein
MDLDITDANVISEKIETFKRTGKVSGQWKGVGELSQKRKILLDAKQAIAEQAEAEAIVGQLKFQITSQYPILQPKPSYSKYNVLTSNEMDRRT